METNAMLSAVCGESCLAWATSGFFIPSKSFHMKCDSSSAPTQLHTMAITMYSIVNILVDEGALGKTSLRLAKAPGNIGLTAGEGNLSKDCVVNISQILVVGRSRFASRIGVLPYNTRLRQIRDFA
ncbi:Uncharacterised protein [Mobiluncus mulieris]|nr:Uncharacterised protein [Mobiluncus mulieris]